MPIKYAKMPTSWGAARGQFVISHAGLWAGRRGSLLQRQKMTMQQPASERAGERASEASSMHTLKRLLDTSMCSLRICPVVGAESTDRRRQIFMNAQFA